MPWCWGPGKGEWKGEPHPSNALFLSPSLSFFLSIWLWLLLHGSPPRTPKAGLCLQEFTVCAEGEGPVAMETASLGAGRSGGDHGRSMHQCKAPRNPQTHPAPRSPSASQGLGVVARGGGPGGGLWHGKRQGWKRKEQGKKIYIIKNPESLQMARPGWAWWLKERLGVLGRGKQGQESSSAGCPERWEEDWK